MSNLARRYTLSRRVQRFIAVCYLIGTSIWEEAKTSIKGQPS